MLRNCMQQTDQTHLGLEGRNEGCRALYSQKWLIGVKRSVFMTHFVLAEGIHQTRWAHAVSRHVNTSLQIVMLTCVYNLICAVHAQLRKQIC